MPGRGSRALASLWLLHSTAACQSLADFEVRYEPGCIPVTDSPYTEEFRGDYQDLTDRCWKEDNTNESEIFVEDGDLVVRLNSPRSWIAESQAPLVYRQIEGDFLAVARAEALSKVNGSHCLEKTEMAGLAVRATEPNLGWATLLVAPFLTDGVACEENAPNPPLARVVVASFNLPDGEGSSPATFEVQGVGADAEADIAVCRTGGLLTYLYRDVENEEGSSLAAWRYLSDGAHDIGDGPVEVGATTTGNYVEGHFNWLVFQLDGAGKRGDGCARALEAFVLPDGD